MGGVRESSSSLYMHIKVIMHIKLREQANKNYSVIKTYLKIVAIVTATSFLMRNIHYFCATVQKILHLTKTQHINFNGILAIN